MTHRAPIISYLEVQSLVSILTLPPLSRAQGSEVLACPRHYIGEEVEHHPTHLNTTITAKKTNIHMCESTATVRG